VRESEIHRDRERQTISEGEKNTPLKPTDINFEVLRTEPILKKHIF